jgi:iron complex transport system substrate-binding protein
LIALQPDLALAWQSGNSPLHIDRVRRLGVPVLVTEVRSLADVPRVVRLVGALAGSEALAEARARSLEDEIETLRRRYAEVRQLEVFLEIWHRPMLTINGAHLISDALRLCGGRNVFAGARTLTPVVSREQVLNARPDVIVTGGFGSEVREAWRGLEPVPAVRSGRIYPIDPDLLHGQGPRVIQGVRALCERLDLARNR